MNGVRLHHADWGGQGEALLFLPGLGDDINRFDSFAPNFTDRFRVLGLTRRGQGQSDQPSSGYDSRTLAQDIRAFLDAMGISKVSLIGHSIAGIEMTMFANIYPERLTKLVYLDAGFGDSPRPPPEASRLPTPQYPNAAIAAIDREAGGTSLAKVLSPALAFFVLFDEVPDDPRWDDKTRKLAQQAFQVYEPLKIKEIQRFRAEVKGGKVIELRDTNHFFFLDARIADGVVREIRQFLLTN